MRQKINIILLFKDQKGITLVELLVVVAVFAVLGVSSLLVIGDQLPVMRLNSGHAALRGEINAARANAIRHNTPVLLMINGPGKTLKAWYDENDNGTVDAGDREIRTTNLPDMVQYGYGTPTQAGAPTGGPGPFSYSGVVVTNTGTFDLGSGRYMITVTNKGWIHNTAGALAGGCIYLSNTYSKFVALEFLSGGVVVPWEYDIKGDGQWTQK
ncbi:prepilin-type N-terminal cleavage/methylation domain-containing protein [candidate division CSSED10-310 bacterium]|uniref:Prepilin-type N-terminal cleavage/methylation domain-containing protein n=1 Tax=candidate division CSSED10-310 bacterium TaxID=2855610 RepID=A0ABV6Z678_UNCC1